MICSTIPNFNLIDNQCAVCHYGQVKKKKQMFLDFISVEKRVCRSFFISGNWKFSLQIISLLQGQLGVLQLNIYTWNITYWLNTNLFFFVYDVMHHTIYLKRNGAFKGHIKNGLLFNVFVFILHLWCYVCRSTIWLWGKMNTASYILVSWAFILVKALVLQKSKLVVNGPASLICSFKTCMYFSVLWNPSGDGSQVVTVCEQHLELWDLDRTASTAEVCLY